MTINILQGNCLDVLKTLPEKSVHCCVTSPPYWGLRNYGVEGQLGLEPTPEEYVEKMVEVFREVHRVLRDDGTLWLNIGDSYMSNANPDAGDKKNMKGRERFDRPNTKKIPGIKQKDLVGIPWMLAFALRADGWYLRCDIIWNKTNPMPESVKDRPTRAHEYIFLLSKSAKYSYDYQSIKEKCTEESVKRATRNSFPNKERGEACIQGASARDRGEGSLKMTEYRNRRSVWDISTKSYNGAHFATFPPKLIEPCILAGCPKGGTVLDPFGGSGTTARVAIQHNRNAILIELNPEYIELQKKRTSNVQRMLV